MVRLRLWSCQSPTGSAGAGLQARLRIAGWAAGQCAPLLRPPIGECTQPQVWCPVVREPSHPGVFRRETGVCTVSPLLSIEHRDVRRPEHFLLLRSTPGSLRRFRGQVLSEQGDREVALDGGAQRAHIASMSFQDRRGVGVGSKSESHPAAVAHEVEQTTNVVDHLAVGIEIVKRLMELGDGGDLAGEVPVEVIAVASSAKQPWPGGWGVESAERFNNVDTSPASYSVGEPEQGLGSSGQPLEGVRCQGPEVIGQQPDRLNQRHVVSRSDSRDQGKPYGDRAPIGPVPDQPPARFVYAISVRPLSHGGDVFVVVNRNVDVVEGVDQCAGKSTDTSQMRFQDERGVLAGKASILRRLRPMPAAVGRIVGIRFPVSRQWLIRGQSVQLQRVLEQRCL